jgi:choline dehydrogenase/4-pyridoxate dehydrogenase
MLSGIGDPDDLKPHGIATAAALRGVGRNLQDHMSVGVAYTRREPGEFFRAMRIDRILRELGQAYFLGRGIAADLPGGVMAFLKSRPERAIPDIQLLFNAAPMTAHPYLAPFKQPYADGFACRAVLLRPESRGELKLASADPRMAVRIRQNFLATGNDWQTLRDGVRLVQRIGKQEALKPFVKEEIAPGPASDSDAAIDAHIRATGITVHHPAGTCKMGVASDPMAVVDQQFRVLGTENLRVVDASVMPDLVGGNINAPVIMMAEKASDLIRGRAPLAPIIVNTP